MNESSQLIKESWIGKFIDFTKPFPTPDIFKKWAGISCVMGALERRVWVRTMKSPLYPNHFVLLVAPPGVGKTMVINQVHELWASTGSLILGPNSATKAAMVDCLAGAKRTMKIGNEVVLYHALQVAAPEFGNLVNEYAHELMNFYNQVWDCPNIHSEKLRYGEHKDISIENVQINLLGGTQPAYLKSILPTEAFGMGFSSRIIMVYCGVQEDPPLFYEDEHEDDLRHAAEKRELIQGLKKILALCGKMDFTPAGKEYFQDWFRNRKATEPSNPKLESYNARRQVSIQKIAMAAAASCDSMIIDRPHLEFANDCLVEVEAQMDEIFKGMAITESSTVMAELHNHVIFVYNKLGKKPVPARLIHDFLKGRLEAFKVPGIIKEMVSCDLIRETATSAIADGKFEILEKSYIPSGRM